MYVKEHQRLKAQLRNQGEQRLINTTSNSEAEKALKEFLLDIGCLDELSKWTNRFNLFDVLKITRTELRHSNMLAWLLDPQESHGLGTAVLQGFVRYAASSFEDQDVFEELLMDLGSFTVQREWRNIDILALSEENRYAIAIENKIDSGEHTDQLDRYRSIVERTYAGWKARFFFLSPHGDEPSDSEHWLPIGYSDVLEIVELASAGKQLSEGASMLINNYLEVIRRDIVEDEELSIICNEIYAKHKRALDLIYENMPDKKTAMAEIFMDWARSKERIGKLSLAEKKCSKTYTRFTTPGMTSMLPPGEDTLGGWNTPDNYFYEIVCNPDDYRLQMCVSSNGLTDDHSRLLETLESMSDRRHRKKDWQWRSYFISKRVKIGDDLDEEKMAAQMDKMFAQALAFENELAIRMNRSTAPVR